MSNRVRSHEFSPLLLAVLLISAPLQAQIVTDGSVGPKVSLRGGEIEIGADLGTRRGGNLFHSFEKFGIATGQTATFTGPSDIRNVISRVTGGDVSSIDGTLKSTVGQADLFLINPAGVMFGPNATLDVPGSFHVSTAHELRFADGARFSALDKTGSGLTAAPPEAFGFLNRPPGRITVDQSQLELKPSKSQLELKPSKTLSLVGGDIDIVGGQRVISTPYYSFRGPTFIGGVGSQINLVSLASAGQAGVGDSTATAERLGTIRLTNGAEIANLSSADLGTYSFPKITGAVHVRSGTLVMENSSIYAHNSADRKDVGGIDFQVGFLTVHNSRIFAANSPITIQAGRIFISDKFAGRTIESYDGEININAGDLELRDNTSIISTTPAGVYSDVSPISVRAENIVISDNSFILSWSEFGKTDIAGNIDIEANTVQLRNGGVISTGTLSNSPSGTIRVKAKHLLISGDGAWKKIVSRSDPKSTGIFTGVSTDASGGSGGRVEIVVDRLDIRDGGEINTSTEGISNAGSVNVQAKNLLISGDGAQVFTGITSSSEPPFSYVSSLPSSIGNAGLVKVEADKIELRNGGAISTDTATNGNAGTVEVQATDHLLISGDGAQRFTGITSATEPGSTGVGGTAIIHARNIQLEKGGSVTVASEGSGSGGSLNITAADTLQLDKATLMGRTKADVGNIKLGIGRLLHLRDSTVSTEGAQGGNMLMQTPRLLLDKSKILSKARLGEGGNIRIEAGQIIRTPDSRIEASGNLTTIAPNTDVSGSLTVLPETLFDASSQLRATCAARSGRPASSFAAGGRGGLLPDPSAPLAVNSLGQPLEQQTATGSPMALTVRSQQAVKMITVSGIPQPVLGSPRPTCRG